MLVAKGIKPYTPDMFQNIAANMRTLPHKGEAVGEPFYPEIQDAIEHMGFDKSTLPYNLKVCLAAACFALVQTPYVQHPQFLDANDDEHGRKLLYYFTVIVRFTNKNGKYIEIPISLHSDPAFVYYAILEEMGVKTEYKPKSIEKSSRSLCKIKTYVIG